MVEPLARISVSDVPNSARVRLEEVPPALQCGFQLSIPDWIQISGCATPSVQHLLSPLFRNPTPLFYYPNLQFPVVGSRKVPRTCPWLHIYIRALFTLVDFLSSHPIPLVSIGGCLDSERIPSVLPRTPLSFTPSVGFPGILHSRRHNTLLSHRCLFWRVSPPWNSLPKLKR